MNRRWSGPGPRLSAVLVAVATVAALGRVCAHEFISYDDRTLIAANPDFNPPTLASLQRQWTQPHDQLYIPAVYSVWWTLAGLGYTETPDAVGGRLNPWLFHTANLTVHMICALLVLALLRRIGFGAWPALVGAMVFAVHPLQVEPVAWATGMKDLLCGMLSLLAVWAYVLHVSADRVWRRRTLYGLALLLFVLAMLSKPSAVIVPVIIWIIAVIGMQQPWRRTTLWLLPWVALAIPLVI